MMTEHTFSLWLKSELTSAKCALLAAYERRDAMIYIERPQLDKEYIEKIGEYEQTVLIEELECELLRKKQKLVQAAINSHQIPVDEEAIDAEIDAERERLIEEIRQADPDSVGGFAALDDEKKEELQELYRKIVKDFHPQLHPEISDVHKELFKKAQEAYRLGDLKALQLIYDMLTTTDGDYIELTMAMSFSIAEGEAGDFTTDYALAAELYGSFKQTSEEAAIFEQGVHYRQLMSDVFDEIEKLRAEFPFTAAEMLSDPEKVEAYKEELAYRMRSATEEKERRTNEIRMMIESVNAHE